MSILSNHIIRNNNFFLCSSLRNSRCQNASTNSFLRHRHQEVKDGQRMVQRKIDDLQKMNMSTTSGFPLLPFVP